MSDPNSMYILTALQNKACADDKLGKTLVEEEPKISPDLFH